jgi:lysophospholipase L1-like esterase
MCERLKYLKGKNARIWFIEGGINDLPHSNVSQLFDCYKRIITFIKTEQATPIINLVMFISPKAGEKWPGRKDYKRINGMIAELNKMLVAYCDENKIVYINMNQVIADNTNVLKNEYTSDGIHLTALGYDVWATKINIILRKNNI